MSYQRLSVQVSVAQAQAVSDLLESAGAASVTIAAATDEVVVQPGPGDQPLWQMNRVSALFAEHDLDGAGEQSLRQRLSALGAERIVRDALDDEDWTQAWRQQAQPRCFGHGLWVVPHHAPAPKLARAVVRLDPGLAFGTGSHPTTALCLEWLAKLELKRKTVLDLGCGSGILSIAAAQLGAARVFAVDHDVQAITATTDNAVRNGVAHCIQAATSWPRDQVDVVLANILANTLIELAPRIAGLHRVDGDLILSGVLASQSQQVWQAYAPAYHSLSVRERQGWVAASASRRVEGACI